MSSVAGNAVVGSMVQVDAGQVRPQVEEAVPPECGGCQPGQNRDDFQLPAMPWNRPLLLLKLLAIGAVAGGGDRGRARAKPRPANERGLTDEQTLADLASVYLEIQRERWPELLNSSTSLLSAVGYIPRKPS